MNRQSLAFLCAVVLGVCALLTSPSYALNIVAVAGGKSSGVFSITQELLLRGHSLRVVVPQTARQSCVSRAGPHLCVLLPRLENLPGAEEYAPEWDERIRLGITDAARKHHFRADIFITDTSFELVDKVARAMNKPAIYVVGESRALHNVIPANSKSPLGDALSGDNRNWLTHVFQHHHVIVPFPFGVGFPDQRRCPNVHIVGFLLERLVSRRGLFDNFNAWIDACRNGIIHVDMKLEVSGDMYFRTVAALNKLSASRDICVAWSALRSDLMQEALPLAPLFVSTNQDVDSETLLGRNNTKFFITTSCDSSTLEAAAKSETVLVVVRSSKVRDRACELLNSSSLGIVIDDTTVGDSLYDYINDIWNDTVVAHEMRREFRFNHLLGGSPKAADTVELVGLLGRNNTDFLCATAPVWQREDWDVSIITSGIIATAVFLLAHVLYPTIMSWSAMR